MEGWLEKKVLSGLRKVWHRRYFRLDLACEPAQLTWSASEKLGSHKKDHTFAITPGDCVVESAADHHAHLNCFELRGGGKDVMASAGTAAG